MSNEWLASGGAYWILGGAWLLGAVIFVSNALRGASAQGREADGCALALGCLVTMSVGGGIGLQLAPYPWYLVTALLLGLLFPAVLTAVGRKGWRR